jgi:hypothetical protein
VREELGGRGSVAGSGNPERGCLYCRVMPVAHRLPSSFKALVLQKLLEQGESVYHDVRIVKRPIPAPKHGEILVKINGAGFNHGELCLGNCTS